MNGVDPRNLHPAVRPRYRKGHLLIYMVHESIYPVFLGILTAARPIMSLAELLLPHISLSSHCLPLWSPFISPRGVESYICRFCLEVQSLHSIPAIAYFKWALADSGHFLTVFGCYVHSVCCFLIAYTSLEICRHGRRHTRCR